MTVRDRASVALDLRAMADNLWNVEYRLSIEEDDLLLREAADLLDRPTAAEWTKIAQPIVSKCEVGSAFGECVVFNKEGADALGKLLKQMATKLDFALDSAIVRKRKPRSGTHADR